MTLESTMNRKRKVEAGDDEVVSLTGKRGQFLDNGEGKICSAVPMHREMNDMGVVRATEETSDDGHTNEDDSLLSTPIKVREGKNPYTLIQHNRIRLLTCHNGTEAAQFKIRRLTDNHTVKDHTPECTDLPITEEVPAKSTNIPLRQMPAPAMEPITSSDTFETDGLRPPKLALTESMVIGKDKNKLRKQNKERRLRSVEKQAPTSQWTAFRGDFYIPATEVDTRIAGKQMAPTGLAALHPAGALLDEWSQFGCPTMTGAPWTKEEMAAAVAKGPHKSALTDGAILHFEQEIREKVAAGQARVIEWSDIEHDPPKQLKISPIAAVPHTSKPYRSILDLSFELKLAAGDAVPSVNDSTEKTAPQASVDQLGHVLTRIIHAFAEAGPTDKVFMAKWDVKDGFWRLDCQEGEEYNFAYVLPQRQGMPVKLVIPTSLQMGWIESPAYFCSASETSRDVAEQYCQTPIGTLPSHKFEQYVTGSDEYLSLPEKAEHDIDRLRFMIEVFVDDFMSLVMATSRRQLRHVGTGTMMGIHDVFPEASDEDEDPISKKKMSKTDSLFTTNKTLLGFDFDGAEKTMWLQEEKRAALLTVLHGWLRSSQRSQAGIPYKLFESVTAKLRHAFTSIPAGLGLLSPCNRILAIIHPEFVYLHRNNELFISIQQIRSLLRTSIQEPTKCSELVGGWPNYIGYTDASGLGFGGIIIGDTSTLPPTVFRGKWPPDIVAQLVSPQNPTGALSINDLEMGGFLLTWLVMEAVCPDLQQTNIALFSDNAPSISWVERLASRRSIVGASLIRALVLRMKIRGVCPLTPLHVAGKRNSMADMASRSFGNVKQWHCCSDTDFAHMFNSLFPLPHQNTWTVFRPTSDICMKVISVLRMRVSSLDEWRRIPRIGRHIGPIGVPTSNLWEWTRTSNIQPTQSGAESFQDSPLESVQDTTAEEDKSKLDRYLQLSHPLARRSLWNVRETH